MSKRRPRKNTSSKKAAPQKKKLNQIKLRYEQYKFDELQMYMDYPYAIDIEGTEGALTIYSPTLGQIIEFGQDRFYMGINPFITNTTAYRLPLWEMGRDWCEMSDFELFVMFVGAKHIDNEAAQILFGDIDWNKFEPSAKPKGEDEVELVLYNSESNIEIDEVVYQHMTQYLHRLLRNSPEEQITTDPVLKNWKIKEEQRKRKNDEWRKEQGMEKDRFSLVPLISACVNHPGFKYKKSELKEISLYEFFDSVNRLQIYESATAAMKGIYSGFVDTSKIDKQVFDFMRPTN